MVNDDSKIIPGHGVLSNKKDMQEYRSMLVTVRERIWKSMKEGKTLEQVIQAEPTKGFKAAFDNKGWIEAAYNSLKKPS